MNKATILITGIVIGNLLAGIFHVYLINLKIK